MTKQIFINLKMYQDSQEELDKYLKNLKDEKITLFPSLIYLEKCIRHGFTCGVQNISSHDSGPYTSEISAKAVKDLGATYALLGHSEVRQNLFETDEVINLKIKKALENNLIPVLCVGENISEYQSDKTKAAIKRQITKALKSVSGKIIVSYEPVWAIGTGKTPTNEEISSAISYIKSFFDYDIKVLYGGSVSDKNIAQLAKIKNLDGFLIGKAGIDISSLNKIIEVVLE